MIQCLDVSVFLVIQPIIYHNYISICKKWLILNTYLKMSSFLFFFCELTQNNFLGNEELSICPFRRTLKSDQKGSTEVTPSNTTQLFKFFLVANISRLLLGINQCINSFDRLFHFAIFPTKYYYQDIIFKIKLSLNIYKLKV